MNRMLLFACFTYTYALPSTTHPHAYQVIRSVRGFVCVLVYMWSLYVWIVPRWRRLLQLDTRKSAGLRSGAMFEDSTAL